MSYSKLHRHVIHAIEHSTQIVMGICNHSIVFFFFFGRLVWVVVDPEVIPGARSVNREFHLDGMLVYCRAQHTCMHFSV